MGVTRDRFTAEPFAVRAALMRFESGALCGMGQEAREVALLVLAEVLNNVAEHAYAGRSGPVAVVLSLRRDGLNVRVTDCGIAAPAWVAAGYDPASLPEGGFGMTLIRAFARKMEQRRRLGCNVLTFRLDGDNGPSGDESFPLFRD